MPATSIFIRDTFSNNTYHILKQVYKSIGSSSPPLAIRQALCNKIGCSGKRIMNWWRKHRYVSKHKRIQETKLSPQSISKIIAYINKNFDILKEADNVKTSDLNIHDTVDEYNVDEYTVDEQRSSIADKQSLSTDPEKLSKYPNFVSNDLNTLALMGSDTLEKLMNSISGNLILIKNINKGKCELCHQIPPNRLNKINNLYACKSCSELVIRQYMIFGL